MKVLIKDCASKKGISLYKLAIKLEIPQQTVYSWANKRTQPNYDNMDSLCEALDCTMSDLFKPEKKEEKIINYE